MTTLEYSKLILEKVGFDAQLFIKELKKALARMVHNEKEELLTWCIARYQFP